MKINTLRRESFKKYGGILEPEAKNSVFTVLCGEEEKTGWRIGYVILKPGETDTLEAHPETLETFEPVKGGAVILAAEKDSPEDIEAFFLDKAVVINKGVWHGVAALSETAEIKVTENNEVETIYHKLEKPLEPAVIQKQKGQ